MLDFPAWLTEAGPYAAIAGVIGQITTQDQVKKLLGAPQGACRAIADDAEKQRRIHLWDPIPGYQQADEMFPTHALEQVLRSVKIQAVASMFESDDVHAVFFFVFDALFVKDDDSLTISGDDLSNMFLGKVTDTTPIVTVFPVVASAQRVQDLKGKIAIPITGAKNTEASASKKREAERDDVRHVPDETTYDMTALDKLEGDVFTTVKAITCGLGPQKHIVATVLVRAGVRNASQLMALMDEPRRMTARELNCRPVELDVISRVGRAIKAQHESTGSICIKNIDTWIPEVTRNEDHFFDRLGNLLEIGIATDILAKEPHKYITSNDIRIHWQALRRRTTEWIFHSKVQDVHMHEDVTSALRAVQTAVGVVLGSFRHTKGKQ